LGATVACVTILLRSICLHIEPVLTAAEMAAFSPDITPGDLPPLLRQTANEPDMKKLLDYVDFNLRRNIEPYFLTFGRL
jgi:hypothetical protein